MTYTGRDKLARLIFARSRYIADRMMSTAMDHSTPRTELSEVNIARIALADLYLDLADSDDPIAAAIQSLAFWLHGCSHTSKPRPRAAASPLVQLNGLKPNP